VEAIRVRGVGGGIVYEATSGERVLSPSLTRAEMHSGSVMHRLEHFQQSERWDCGVVCVSMILRYWTRTRKEVTGGRRRQDRKIKETGTGYKRDRRGNVVEAEERD
jgi:hypothetical protein